MGDRASINAPIFGLTQRGYSTRIDRITNVIFRSRIANILLGVGLRCTVGPCAIVVVRRAIVDPPVIGRHGFGSEVCLEGEVELGCLFWNGDNVWSGKAARGGEFGKCRYIFS